MGYVSWVAGPGNPTFPGGVRSNRIEHRRKEYSPDRRLRAGCAFSTNGRSEVCLALSMRSDLRDRAESRQAGNKESEWSRDEVVSQAIGVVAPMDYRTQPSTLSNEDVLCQLF